MKYTISNQRPSVNDFDQLVRSCDLIVKDKAAIEIGLQNALFNITIYNNDQLIGMGRIVGDGATVFHIVDVAVSPDYQGNGLGKIIMTHIMDYIEEHRFKGTYVNLISEMPANYLYEKYGFQYVKDSTPAMYIEY
ncbi:GNAT family N-acetyltransferase [Mammaliicoccus sp. Dog046]|uniref:GNAT family N-acetyltransferase n=1 Tax=Mammaliicoccus sp. Dog046 TaxID=3034233 RepID=UPI002B25A06C|nr:GNAT family N-acetyltransferase [Mammaliicoccus sp. Dog046]WQK85572.1 GNAT family N-acetyltransferase [Mammaliicoccus sp. Dog046]